MHGWGECVFSAGVHSKTLAQAITDSWVRRAAWIRGRHRYWFLPDLYLWCDIHMHRMQFIPWHRPNPDTAPLVRIPVTLVESESVDESGDGRFELGDMRSVCVCVCVCACVRVCVGVY